MSVANPITDSKPSKPYPEFPLFPHATKRWAKKIRGKLHYFGPWADPDAALNKYLENKDSLHSGLTPPSKKTIRVECSNRGLRMIEADDLRKLLNSAGTPMKAMILLGLNCGFGQSDLANLPLAALDLEGGWIDYPRPKTAIGRRCPLWPETIEALREAIGDRPKPKAEGDAGIVFMTKYGKRWVRIREREGKAAVAIDSVRREFNKLLGALKIKRAGLGFYALRHTHRNAADGAKDPPAADLIMGHARDDMASVYRERISDDRLKAVADHVRDWLFEENAKARA